MVEIHEPCAFLEDPPAVWPPRVAEKVLPSGFEGLLTRAIQAVLDDREGAIGLAEQAVTLARDSGDAGVLARCLSRAAGVLCLARRAPRAYAMCLEAQSLLERLDDLWRAAKVLQMRGCCCLGVGEHERAQALFAEASGRFQKLGDRAELARCHALMAMALRLGGELTRAVDFAARSVATLQPSENPQLRCRLHHAEAFMRLQLGHHHAGDGRAGLAREEYTRAFHVLPDVRMVDVSRWTPTGASLLDTIAGVALVQGEQCIARLALHQLAAWARRWKSPLARGLAWLRLAEFRRRQGRLPGALACARRGVARLACLPGTPTLPGAQRLLADLLETAGDLKGAYEALAGALRSESQLQQGAMAMRAELLALDLDAERDLHKTGHGQRRSSRWGSDPLGGRSTQSVGLGALSSVGHLVAGVNHELNQPLASIRMLAETALGLIHQGDHAAAQGNLHAMRKLSGRLTDMASKLAAFPAHSESAVCSVCLADAVDEALATLRSRLVQTPCEIRRELPALAVRAQEAQLVRVIANLVNNALDAVAHCAQRRIAFACSTADEVVTLSVSDSGPGLSEVVRQRLFLPFFSTKPAGQGLGLGLALSRDVMREMGGDLTARNGSEGGAVFEIRLPLAIGVAPHASLT